MDLIEGRVTETLEEMRGVRRDIRSSSSSHPFSSSRPWFFYSYAMFSAPNSLCSPSLVCFFSQLFLSPRNKPFPQTLLWLLCLTSVTHLFGKRKKNLQQWITHICVSRLLECFMSHCQVFLSVLPDFSLLQFKPITCPVLTKRESLFSLSIAFAAVFRY